MEKKAPTVYIAIIVVLLVALGGAVGFLLKSRSQQQSQAKGVDVVAEKKAAPAPAAMEAKPMVNVRKSLEDFKVGEVKVQRPKGTKGSRLIYAVGSVTNSSGIARMGVKVELDLLNSGGTKIDSTSDYIATLGPGEAWSFKGVVHDPLAVSAKVAKISEDN